MTRSIGLVVLASLLAPAAALGASGEEPTLVETWVGPEAPVALLKNLLIVAISDDQERRHEFEDKFVVHLRTAGITGVPSHTLVAELDKVEDREALLLALEDKGVDGGLTVRLVPMDTKDEKVWAEQWRSLHGSGTRIRKLIEESIPTPKEKAKRYGIELALWEARSWSMIWSGRTALHAEADLKGQAGAFVGITIRALQDAGMIR